MQRSAASLRPYSLRWAWLGAVVGVCLALVTQAPARWLTGIVANASAMRVLLLEPQGTVWKGSALWVLNSGPAGQAASSQTAGTALPTRLHWQLSPGFDFSHFRFRLTLRLQSLCCTPQPLQLEVAPLWRGLHVRVNDHQSSWPAEWLTGLGAPWNTVQPEGLLQLGTRDLSWQWQAGRPQVQGQAELRITDLATRLSTLRPLGSYRLTLNGGDTIAFTLDTLEGRLQLAGQGQWSPQGLRFRGEASTQPEFENALSNLLNILGQRQGAKSILQLGS